MSNRSNLKLIKNCTVYGPVNRGRKDILVGGGRILQVSDQIPRLKTLDLEVIDVKGKPVAPGFIDLHVHTTGGGGEAGPGSRVPELRLSEITKAGLTTVVGTLGTDNVTRDPETLLVKAKELNQYITSFIYTGSYHIPSPTITGSVKSDVALINEVVGVKVAITDHRSSVPTTNELAKLATKARVGGMLGDKPGLVHLHVGGDSKGLSPITDVLKDSEIPPNQFLPTHVARDSELLEEALEFVRIGGNIDITCPGDSANFAEEVEEISTRLKATDVPLRNVTFSTDGNGSLPRFDDEGDLIGLGQGNVTTLHETFVELVKNNGFEIPEALSLVTANPARRLGIYDQKGSIEAGKDADLLVLSDDLEIEKVFAGGTLMVDQGSALVKGNFE